MSIGIRSCLLLSQRLRLRPFKQANQCRVLLLCCADRGDRPLGAVTKPHIVFLGSGKNVPYSIAGDPAGAMPEEKQFAFARLLVDGKVKEWTNGESHAITDRSFVVRRALRLNDCASG